MRFLWRSTSYPEIYRLSNTVGSRLEERPFILPFIASAMDLHLLRGRDCEFTRIGTAGWFYGELNRRELRSFFVHRQGRSSESQVHFLRLMEIYLNADHQIFAFSVPIYMTSKVSLRQLPKGLPLVHSIELSLWKLMRWPFGSRNFFRDLRSIIIFSRKIGVVSRKLRSHYTWHSKANML